MNKACFSPTSFPGFRLCASGEGITTKKITQKGEKGAQIS